MVSLYFDDKTNEILDSFKDKERMVPHHITVASFDTKEKNLDSHFTSLKELKSDEIHFVALGILGKDTLIINVMLNEYLHEISKAVHSCLEQIPDVKVSQKYRVWGWLPHVTLASKCSYHKISQLLLADKELFHDFKGKVVRISVSSTRPYKDIVGWDLQRKEEK